MSVSDVTIPVSRGALFAALAKAQSKIRTASKDSKNPHFNSKYADLASVAEACREALTENGICVLQDPSTEGNQVTCITILGHSSGESYESKPLAMVPRDLSPQSVGSCVTYLRRYQLASVVGVAPDDDDGNAAQNGGGFPKGSAGGGRSAAPRAANTNDAGAAGAPPADGKDYVPANKIAVKAGDPPINPGQAERIHALQKQFLDEQTYRLTWLGSYKKHDGSKCETSKDLTFDQATNLIKRMTSQAAKREQRAEAAMSELAPSLASQPPAPRAQTPRNLEDELTRTFQFAEDERNWLHSYFGVELAKELDRVQSETAIQLLLTWGTPMWDSAETSMRAAGKIR